MEAAAVSSQKQRLAIAERPRVYLQASVPPSPQSAVSPSPIFEETQSNGVPQLQIRPRMAAQPAQAQVPSEAENPLTIRPRIVTTQSNTDLPSDQRDMPLVITPRPLESLPNPADFGLTVEGNVPNQLRIRPRIVTEQSPVNSVQVGGFGGGMTKGDEQYLSEPAQPANTQPPSIAGLNSSPENPLLSAVNNARRERDEIEKENPKDKNGRLKSFLASLGIGLQAFNRPIRDWGDFWNAAAQAGTVGAAGAFKTDLDETLLQPGRIAKAGEKLKRAEGELERDIENRDKESVARYRDAQTADVKSRPGREEAERLGKEKQEQIKRETGLLKEQLKFGYKKGANPQLDALVGRYMPGLNDFDPDIGKTRFYGTNGEYLTTNARGETVPVLGADGQPIVLPSEAESTFTVGGVSYPTKAGNKGKLAVDLEVGNAKTINAEADKRAEIDNRNRTAQTDYNAKKADLTGKANIADGAAKTLEASIANNRRRIEELTKYGAKLLMTDPSANAAQIADAKAEIDKIDTQVRALEQQRDAKRAEAQAFRSEADNLPPPQTIPYPAAAVRPNISTNSQKRVTRSQLAEFAKSKQWTDVEAVRYAENNGWTIID